MERGLNEKVGHSHGLPPAVPLPPSSNSNGGGATAQSEIQSHQLDAKKLRRVLASRQYSQKYRMKQIHYIMQLETEVKALHAEVTISEPRIKYVKCQNSLLRAENSSMKQKLSAFSGELTFKEAQYEDLKRERQILKQLCMMMHQHQEKPALNHGFNHVG